MRGPKPNPLNAYADIIIKMYVVDGLTLREIAAKFSCGHRDVDRVLKKHGVKPRQIGFHPGNTASPFHPRNPKNLPKEE